MRLAMAGRLAAVALATLLLSLTSAPPTHHTTIDASKAATTGSWPEYHLDDGHTGYDSSVPAFTGVGIGWTSQTLDGDVYASTLIFNGVVYAATLNNTVYALKQSDGTQLWSKNLGAPQTSGWGCGNVSPMGIVGTPVIDTSANRLYAVAELAGTTPTYHLFGLDLANSGNVVLNATIAPLGFDWHIQGERGALTLHNGFVYVPFGGLFGDCGSYHGWVVGVPTSGTGGQNVYETANTGSGLWGAGGLVVDDSTGSVFGATGNGGCSAAFGQNDSVVRLSSTLALQDYFAPQDWQSNWCNPDQDLGSAGPLLISSNLLFQAGKRGGGFLLNPSSLGGIDGQLYPTPKPATYAQADVCLGNTGDATFGSFAYAAPFVYLECDGHGLVALNVNTSTPSFTACGTGCGAPDWSAGGSTTYGPPIVAGGAVWAVSSGGGLTAFNAMNGSVMYQSPGFNVHHFVTPAEAGGTVYVPSINVIRTFNMNFLTWTSLGGVLTSGPDASSWSSTRTDAFVRGTDNQLWQRTWNGTAWSASWTPLGGVLTSDPSAVSGGPNSIDVFVDGTDHAVWHRHFDGTSWLPWESLGGYATCAPDASSWGLSRLDLIVCGTDHALHHRSWDGTSWAAWDTVGSGGYATSNPSVVSWGSGRVDVFVRGTDNALWHISGDVAVGWSGWDSLGGVLATGPDAASCATNHLDVFVTGTDGGLWQKGYNGNGVSWGPWLSWGAHPTADPGAVCQPGTTSIMLFARGTDNALWQTVIPGS
jgi:PQQ-like domain